MARLTELPGRTLDGKYHLDKLLGQGGMGAVYLATHLGTKRPVALKVIAPQFMANEEFVERFRREAEAAGRLRHPNVVNVTDFGFTSSGVMNLAYLVMEYLDGRSLGDMLKERGRLPLGFVIDVVEQICLAVNMAHEQGIIHRDLKPDNIWLEPDQRGGYNVKVLDFGLAKLHDSAPADVGGDLAPTLPDQSTQLSKRPDTIKAGARTSPQHQDVTQLEAATELQAATQHQATVTGEEQTQILDRQTSQDSIDFEAATQMQPLINRHEAKTGLMSGRSTSERSTPSGIDLSAASASNLTRVGAVMGTPLYMSPEQCRGETLDPKSDIYSLGIIIYQMLAGAPPFTGDMNELISRHTDERPAPLAEKRADIPRSVAELVMTALAKNPAERPGNASVFARALRAAAETDVQILQEARSYFYNHIPGFLFLSLIIYLPFAIPTVMFAHKFTKPEVMKSPLVDVLFWTAVFLVIQVANRLNIAACTLAVHQLRLRQRGPLRIRSILFNLLKRLPSLLVTSLLGDLISLVSLVKLILPGLKSFVNYSLAAPVVMMEKKNVTAALARSKALADRLRPLASGATLRSISFIACSIMFLPSLVVTMATIFSGSASGGGSIREAYPVMIGFAWFLIIALYSYNALPLVLIYFKARQAMGETLEESSAPSLDQEKITKQRGLLNRKTLVWMASPVIMFALVAVYSIRFTGPVRQDTLTIMASRGRHKEVKRMLAEGADPNERTRNGRTAIMSAAGQGYADVVKALIEGGADVNAKDNDGNNALLDTARQGRTDLAKLLIESGANLNETNNEGETALLIAARRGFAAYVKTLLALGADPKPKDKMDKTALDYAEEEERADMIQALINAGAKK
jgi:serine/threonine protein kinase